MEYEVGAILEGKVTSITKFGAFVALEGGKSGLVHISEIANTYVNDVHDFLQEGQVVKVKLLAIKEGKLDLSIKKALPATERPAQRSFQPRPAAARPAAPRPAAAPRRPSAQAQAANTAPSGDMAFEDKLKQFMTQSDSKQSELNRYMAGKRGSGRRRR